MKNKIVAIAIIISAVLITIGMMNGSLKGESKPMHSISFDGTWKTSTAPLFTATIKDRVVRITWEVDPSTTALYWQGTFPDPIARSTNNVLEIESIADVDSLDSSMLASTDTSKVFTYSDGVLSYNFSIAGISKIINLKR